MPLGEASGEELEMTGEARTHTQTMMTAQQGAGAERELKFVADPKTFKADSDRATANPQTPER
jgi:hypothetical protein